MKKLFQIIILLILFSALGVEALTVENVRAVQGSSDYLWQARAIGTYYPPISYNYALGLHGEQKAKVYPYVPFAGILHRSFNRVFGTVKIYFQLHGHVNERGWLGDLNPSPSYEERKANVEKEPESFEIVRGERGEEAVITYTFSAAGQGWEDLDGVRANIKIKSIGDEDASFKIDATFKDGEEFNFENQLSVRNAATADKQTERGVFKVELGGTSNDSCKNYIVTIKIKLYDGFAYSRLTNRFVPWYGMVNQKHPQNTDTKNIPSLLSDITKLGFPGFKFFQVGGIDLHGSCEAQRELITILDDFDSTKYSTLAEMNKALEDKLKTAYFTGYTGGNDATAGYDSYLSEENFTIIPVTTPKRRDLSGNVVEGTGEFKKEGLRWTASINYELTGDASPIAMKWPYDPVEYATLEAIYHTGRLNYLRTNPQEFTINNAALEIDKDDLIDKSNAYLAANPSLLVEDGLKKQLPIDTLTYNKATGNYSKVYDILGHVIPKPDYVSAATYEVLARSDNNLTISFAATNPASSIVVSTVRSGQPWSSADDPVLNIWSGGKIISSPETFNAEYFSADGKSPVHYFWQSYKNKYFNSLNAADPDYNRAVFWRSGESLVENPNVAIDKWEVAVKDATGRNNEDITVGDITTSGPLLDGFRAKLKYEAKEQRWVKLTGKADGYFELFYFDGESWIKFADGTPNADGTFSRFWNVGRLCGKHTILLRSGSSIDYQDLYIGDVVYTGVDTPENRQVTSAYRRAEVYFKPTSFNRDEFASVTPVTLSEISLNKKLIIKTHGPIVELKPSPSLFKTPADGDDLRPYLRFLYTAQDLKDGFGIDLSPDDPDWRQKTADLCIHQVTAKGDLEIIPNSAQTLYKDENNQPYFAFEAALDHFSTYALLKGKFKLSAPLIFSDRYITNKDSVKIFGTAEPGSILELYVADKPLKTFDGLPNASTVASSDEGYYRFNEVPIVKEGENYVYIFSHLPDQPDVKTSNDLVVVKDTVAPTVEATPNLYAFSPNGDGKYDSIDYTIKANEAGQVYVSLLGPKGEQLLIDNFSVIGVRQYKAVWMKGRVVYFALGNDYVWREIKSVSLPDLTDGDYIFAIYAIDEAGNVGNNVIVKTTVDTTPPTVLGLNAAPNPFTPNDDGIKDTTGFWYKLSEPSAVKLGIYQPDGELFKNMEATTDNFQFPTSQLLVVVPTERRDVSSVGSYQWDGRGNSNELLGGNYSYYIYAEDWVGNSATSEIKAIVVDRAPTLISYLFAEPDPFSPASGAAIKYYLSRDDLKVNLAITGEQIVTTLLKDASQGKGEHAVYWSGRGGDGEKVSDGSYLIKLAVIGSDGISAEASNTVRVDGTAPTVILRPVQIDGKQATVTFMVPEDSTVDVTLTCDDGKAAPLMTCEAKTAGEYKLIFDEEAVGSRGTVTVRAVDRSSNEATASEKFAFAAATILDHLADPAIFTPNGDGHTDTTRIAYKLSGGTQPYIVNVDVVNAIGTTIRRLAENDEQSSGSYSFYWDGKSIVLSSAETYVPDGEYHYQITATDADGVKVEASGRLEAAGGKITPDFTLNPAAFSPNGDDNNETMAVNYSVIYPPFYVVEGEPSVLLSVLSANGETLFETGLERSSGSYSYVYDGRTNYPAAGLSSGSLLPTGKYYAKITIQDRLGTITSLTKDFAVDVTNPMVIISSEAGMIANPGSFSTNANPDGSDRPRATTLYYKLTEDTLVSVKVYKIDNNKNDYQRSDFTAGNLVATLVNGQWQSGGQQYQVNWDGKMAGGDYADPGKYAFIVEGEDSLGNATLRKWGGTVWVQNNVLSLRSPEQLELPSLDVSNNPDPQVISPNGNSQEPAQKRARFYFMIDLSLNPATVSAAERIETMGVTVNTKSVGKYSVKVYSDSAMSNLVRTITTDAVAQSGTLSWEDWDGKTDMGAYASNGNYWLAVDLEDYADNHLTKLTGQIVVDNAPPTIKNVVAAPYYFAPGGTNSTSKTTTCTYEVDDNSSGARLKVEIFKDGVLVKTITADAWRTNGEYSIDWDGTGATGYVGSANGSSFSDGAYSFNLSAIDEAGNLSVVQSVEVKVDTQGPAIVLNGQAPAVWYSANNPILINFSDPSGYAGYKSSWLDWPTNDFSGLIASNESIVYHPNQGEQTLYIKAWDLAGNRSEIQATYKRDYTSPEASFSGQAFNVWYSSDNPISVNLSDLGGSGFQGLRWAWDLWPVDDPSGSNPVPSFTTNHGNEGPRTLYVLAWDKAGNRLATSRTYYRDATPPQANFGGQAANVWYRGNQAITISPTDNYSYRGFKWSWYSWPDTDPSGCITLTSGVNYHPGEGPSALYVRTWDMAGNRRDESQVYYRDSVAPNITISSTTPASGTFNPYVDGTIRVDFTALDGAPSSGFAIGNISSVVKYGSQVVKTLTVQNNAAGGYYISWDGTNNSGDYENEGSYSIEIGAVDNIGNNAITRNIDINLLDDQRLLQHSNVLVEITGFDISTQDYMTLQWHDGPDNNPYYEKGCGKEYQAKIVSAAVNPRSGIVPKSANYSIDNYRHIVSISNGNVYYKRIVGNDIYGPVKVFNGGNATDVAICAENNNSSYIAWIINIGQFDELFFQKIPINFAPITGTKLGASAITKGIMAAATLESPSLIAPARDQQAVQNIRPAFEWSHHKADTTDYRIEVAKNDSFTIDHQTFSKAAGTGTQDKANSELYYYNYAIHEFDPGLERNTDYFWKVTALSPTNAATSEAWSFRVQPELTLVGVTNYPNPFNPNREETKIRYRLSSDADEVKIRIYDLTGSLVTELDGTTNGEGTSVWQKYNDVSWDGRNGRGDLVVNGIYPFEVTARIGDRTVRGRGKIAVLK